MPGADTTKHENIRLLADIFIETREEFPVHLVISEELQLLNKRKLQKMDGSRGSLYETIDRTARPLRR